MSEDQKDMNKKEAEAETEEIKFVKGEGNRSRPIWGGPHSLSKEDRIKLTKEANGRPENNKLMLSDEDAFKIGKVFMHVPKYEVEGLLLDTISLDTVVPLLGLAEKHNCNMLKRGCLKFIVQDRNWVSLRFQHEYCELLVNQPSLLDDIKEMAQNLGI